ncbi:MAG: hypothetical protein OQL28_03265 [Sedimenticola sp.]|nr:hypothetical protein [Sedimenticola sp.]
MRPEAGGTIRRTLDGSIDFRYYERRGRRLRAQAAGDIFEHISGLLPFFRPSVEPDGDEETEQSGQCLLPGCGSR